MEGGCTVVVVVVVVVGGGGADGGGGPVRRLSGVGRARAQNGGDDAHRETGYERELCKAAHRQTVDLSAISLLVLSQKQKNELQLAVCVCGTRGHTIG